MDNYTEDEFHDISVDYGKSTSISQVGMEVLAPSNFDIKLRMTPLDDVQDIAEGLGEEEGDLCIAGPSIDIEDVEVLLSKSEVIKFRHNILKWDTCKKFELRLYRSTKSTHYEELKAELTDDHIIVCPNNPYGQQGTNQQGQHALNQLNNAEQAQGRSSGIDDEGYGQGASSPSANVARIVPVVEEIALSNLEIHFHRKKHETCSEDQPHSITIHVAFDNERSRSSLEASMQVAGTEEAAWRIEVVSIDRQQTYTPSLGTYPKNNCYNRTHITSEPICPPGIVWDGGRLTPFSYLHLNKTTRGFMELQKFPPPDPMMACDGDYKYIRLNQHGKGIPSDDPICSDIPPRIKPKACRKDNKSGSESESEGSRSMGRKRRRQERQPSVIHEESPSVSNDESLIINNAYSGEISSVSQGSVQLPRNAQRQNELGRPRQRQSPNWRERERSKPMKKQCPYCDQTLSRKQAWDKHKKRKHSTLHDVDWVHLNPVQTSQESAFRGEAIDGASADPPTNLHIPNPVTHQSSSSSQEDTNRIVLTQETMHPVTLSYSEAHQSYNPLVGNAHQQDSTTNLPHDFSDLFSL